jgi:hypothetical protein
LATVKDAVTRDTYPSKPLSEIPNVAECEALKRAATANAELFARTKGVKTVSVKRDIGYELASTWKALVLIQVRTPRPGFAQELSHRSHPVVLSALNACGPDHIRYLLNCYLLTACSSTIYGSLYSYLPVYSRRAPILIKTSSPTAKVFGRPFFDPALGTSSILKKCFLDCKSGMGDEPTDS